MNENLKKKLTETLREYAESLLNDKKDIYTKLEEMDNIQNMFKIINNYAELEPLLRKFFKEKAEKDKWERGN